MQPWEAEDRGLPSFSSDNNCEYISESLKLKNIEMMDTGRNEVTGTSSSCRGGSAKRAYEFYCSVKALVRNF